MGDDDENDVEDTSGYERSGVWPAWLCWEKLLSVLIHDGLGRVPAVLGTVDWLAHEILLSPSFSRWFPLSAHISHFVVLNSTITWKYKVKSSLAISPCHDEELTLSTVYTEYSIDWVQHTLSTAYSEYCIHRILHHPKIYCLPLLASLSSCGRPYCTELSIFPQLRVNQRIESQHPSRLPPELPPPSCPPLCTTAISLYHGLQVDL